MTGRLFVLDPVCALPYGHNLEAMKYFQTYFEGWERFDEVACVACRHLGEQESARAFHRLFEFYYQDLLPIPSGPHSEQVARLGHVEYGQWLDQACVADARAVFGRFGITAADRLFYPSADFYGALGLLVHLADLPAEEWPRVHLRFVGALEGGSRHYAEPRALLLALLRRRLGTGRLFISAETPVYASFLSEALSVPVSVTPYPLMSGELDWPGDDEPFTVFFPGAARHDKGFLRIAEIIGRFQEEYYEAFGETRPLRVYAQDLRPQDAAAHLRHIGQLCGLPGFHLLPDSLPTAEMRRHAARAHVFVLPYAADVYALRGSAVLMEALAFGRPVVAEGGTGFADQIRYYRAGSLCATPAEYVASLMACARTPAAALRLRAAQARHRFAVDSEAAYREWIR